MNKALKLIAFVIFAVSVMSLINTSSDNQSNKSEPGSILLALDDHDPGV